MTLQSILDKTEKDFYAQGIALEPMTHDDAKIHNAEILKFLRQSQIAVIEGVKEMITGMRRELIAPGEIASGARDDVLVVILEHLNEK